MSKDEKSTVPPPNPKEKLGSGLRPTEETKPKDFSKKVEEPKVEPKEDLTKKEAEKWAATLDDLTGYAKLTRIERMLEWLVVQRVTDNQKLIKQPNIADILKEIMSKMDDKKTEGGEKKGA